ncbi:MAG: uracil-DNA glycosylase [Sphingomonadales bacterium]
MLFDNPEFRNWVEPVRAAHEPAPNCAHCPRLADFRTENAVTYPAFFNRPVPAFGVGPSGRHDARLLIVGLAPGLKGANRTGRPFTGDYAGDLLYPTLIKFGFAVGEYGANPEDGLQLRDAIITNAVRCVPPANKPTPAEIRTCRQFLTSDMHVNESLCAIVALGRVAHESVLTTFGVKKSAHPFGHGAQHNLPGGLRLFDSYHCSRYNTNTGRLTPTMFEAVFEQVRTYLG